MNRLLITLLALTVSTGTLYAQKEKTQPAAIAIGTALPEAARKLKATDGKQYTLNSRKTGKGLIVMFSCNTCPYVIKSQKRTLEVIGLAKEKGFGMVVINSNDAQRDGADAYEAMKTYAQQQGYTVPYLFDEGAVVADAFGATRTPEVFLFDGKTGKLVYRGAMEDNPSDPAASEQMYLQQAMEDLVAGRPVDPEVTKSIGCTIKRKG